MLLTILVTLAVLALLILVHELGHFVAARWFDVRVPRFSIGLGPKLVSFRRGETEYRISALPLGGYVKVAGLKEMSTIEGGDDGEDAVDDRGRTFEEKPPAARAVILAAGVAMNAALAVALFALVAVLWGTPVPDPPVVGNIVEERLPPGAAELASVPMGSRITAVGGVPVETMDAVARAISRARPGPLTFEFEGRAPITIEVPRVPRERQLLPLAIDPLWDHPPVIGGIAQGRAADRAGIRSGDRVLAVDGRPIETWQQLVARVEGAGHRTLVLDVERRDGERARVELRPGRQSTLAGVYNRMGVGRDRSQDAPQARERRTALAGIGYGFTQSWEVVVMIRDFLAGLIDGRHSARELGGPILIGQLSGLAARAGLPVLLMFVALLSINLAIINLLPIPALDGGHLMFLAVETVRGRPASERTRMALGRLGTLCVLLLMVWAVASDVLRILGL